MVSRIIIITVGATFQMLKVVSVLPEKSQTHEIPSNER